MLAGAVTLGLTVGKFLTDLVMKQLVNSSVVEEVKQYMNRTVIV